MSLSPVYIVGIFIACTILAGVGVWLAWRRWKTRRLALTPDNESFDNEKSGGLPTGPRWVFFHPY